MSSLQSCWSSPNGCVYLFFFFFKDPPTTEIYPLPLPDALPISRELCRRGAEKEREAKPPHREDGPHHAVFLPAPARGRCPRGQAQRTAEPLQAARDLDVLHQDRKSTRLNSSHSQISYAVFCLKK